jgi:hypothetical protein
MTMRKLAVGLGVVVLLAGGGLAGATLYASRQAERQLSGQGCWGAAPIASLRD